MPSHNRILWIDYMKAFSCMAVVLNHTHIMPEIKTAVYLVCLPAFFFAAGLFTNAHVSPGVFFKKQTIRLLVPYIVWGILCWAVWFVIARHYGEEDADAQVSGWYPLVGMVCGKAEMLIHNRPLWFLCCLMSLEWIYYVLCRIPHVWLRWGIIIMTAAIGCVVSYVGHNWPWEVSAAMIILPLYAFSAENSTYIKEKARALRTSQLWLMVGCAIIGVSAGYLYNGDVALHYTDIGNPLLYYLTIVSVVVLWFSVSLLIDKHLRPARLLSYIGQNTLFILCTHITTFGLIKGLALICHIPLGFFEGTTGSLCLMGGAFLILLPTAYLMNRFCPWLVGKRLNL